MRFTAFARVIGGFMVDFSLITSFDNAELLFRFVVDLHFDEYIAARSSFPLSMCEFVALFYADEFCTFIQQHS